MASKDKRIIQTLKKYDVFALTPHRRIVLAETLMRLEKRKIRINTAKKKLREEGILFTPRIMKALEKAGKS